MLRRFTTLLLLIIPAFGSALAQRGGAHPFQRPADPILNIDYQSTKSWRYIRLSTLLKMHRTAVEVIDPKTKSKNVYEGVSLKELMSPSQDYQVQVFQDCWGFRDRQALTTATLTRLSEIVVADTLNHKRLGEEYPFRLIADDNKGREVVVKNLAYIRLARKH